MLTYLFCLRSRIDIGHMRFEVWIFLQYVNNGSYFAHILLCKFSLIVIHPGYYFEVIFKFLNHPSELFPTQKPRRPSFLLLNCWITSEGSFASLTNTFTSGYSTSMVAWNQSVGSGTGDTGFSYFSGKFSRKKYQVFFGWEIY